MNSIIRNILKLGLAGAVIAGIWFVALTQDATEPAGEVATAHADVAAFLVGDDGGNFTRAMVSLGLEPRPYDFNGNKMFFAAGATQKSPTELESIISDALVEYGVNETATTSKPPATLAASAWEFPTGPDDEGEVDTVLENLERLRPHGESMLNGDVVTVRRDKDLLRMVGVDWNGTKKELIDNAEREMPTREISAKKLMGGYRYIEAMHDPADGRTDITAVWSADEDFDADKMDNTAFLQQAPDPNVPSCMGCSRTVRMQSLAKDEPVQANHWHTNMGLNNTYEFYKSAMATRGWKQSNVQVLLDQASQIVPELAEIEGRILHLEREGKAMQIVLLPSTRGGTDVFSNERFEGAESILGK